MSWTEERVELLGKLWLEGRSASQIAAELGPGVTRNAVIGKVHRLGLAGRPKTPGVSTVQAKSKPKLVMRGPDPSAARDKADAGPAMATLPTPLSSFVEAVEPVNEVVVPFSERVTIMELRESSCRWPMGDPMNPEFRFCGARTGVGGGPYCAAHSRLAFQPAPERRRDRTERYAKIA